MFAHPTTNSINIVGKVIGGFVFAANLFSFALILSAVVAERERGLRQALKTAGMLESSAWGRAVGRGRWCSGLRLARGRPAWSRGSIQAWAATPLGVLQASSAAHLLLAPCLDPPARRPPPPAGFWLSWLAVEVVAAVVFTLLLIAFGEPPAGRVCVLLHTWPPCR